MSVYRGYRPLALTCAPGTDYLSSDRFDDPVHGMRFTEKCMARCIVAEIVGGYGVLLMLLLSIERIR